MQNLDKRQGQLIALIVIPFFLYSLGGMILRALVPTDAASAPSSLETMAQFGDSFGFWNPIIGILTVWYAVRNLSAISEQIETQKRSEIENMLREKLERILIQSRIFLEIVAADFPQNEDDFNDDFLTKFSHARICALRETDILICLYFPHLKPNLKEIFEADQNLTLALEKLINPKFRSGTDIDNVTVVKNLRQSVVNLKHNIYENSKIIISTSPSIPRPTDE